MLVVDFIGKVELLSTAETCIFLKPSLEKQGKDMFFIFGSPRSGTTLLAQCLNNHSDIVVPHETSFIIPLAFVFTSIREPELGKEMIIRFITRSHDFQTSIGEY